MNSVIDPDEIECQFPAKLAFLFEPAPYKILYGGRYGMKSWGVARALLLLGADRPLRVLCTREFQASISDSVHQLLCDQIANMGLSDFYSIQETVIKGENGTTFSFSGLRQKIDSLKSYEGADVIWVEEAQVVSKRSWDKLIPTLRKEGAEMWITFNPEFEDDETYARFIANPPNGAVIQMTSYKDAEEVGWLSEKARDDIEHCKRRSMADYLWIYAGNCKNWTDGAIYAEEIQAAIESKRVTAVPHDPYALVYTAWDLGFSDDTSIWFYQVIHGEIHILESFGRNGGSVARYVEQITGRKTQIDIINGEVVVKFGDDIPELAHRQAYRYGRHHLPHDAKARTLAAHGKSVIEQLAAALTWQMLAIVPNLSVEDGIQAARLMFQRCWFDENGTADGLRALKRYQRKQHVDGKSYAKSPLHDWTSHYADAFRMMGVAWKEPPPALPTPEGMRGIGVGSNTATLNELFATAGPRKSDRI